VPIELPRIPAVLPTDGLCLQSTNAGSADPPTASTEPTDASPTAHTIAGIRATVYCVLLWHRRTGPAEGRGELAIARILCA